MTEGSEQKPYDTKGALIFGVPAILAMLWLFAQCTKEPDGQSSYERYESAVADGERLLWEPPEGYSAGMASTGQMLGTKWVTPTAAECGYHDYCFSLWVVMAESCPRSLYSAITILDANGNNVGWTNDTAQGVRAGEPTQLIFGTHERGAHSARLAEINCY